MENTETHSMMMNMAGILDFMLTGERKKIKDVQIWDIGLRFPGLPAAFSTARNSRKAEKQQF